MTDKCSPCLKKDKMPSIRTPQSAAKAAESKSLKRKLFDDEKKPSKPASIKRKKTTSQPGSPTLNTGRSHPLSERQQLALLKKLTDKEAKDSSPGTPVKHDSQTIISTFKKGVNKKNERGETALHKAAINNDAQLTKNLIKQGADVNIQDFASWTPLHEACNHGSYDVAKQLLKAGAYVNILGLENDTPLHDAAINGHVKLVEVLLKHGADPLLMNKKGKAPLDVARSPEIRALMKNEIIESCSDSSLMDGNSPTSPESLSSAEESTPVRDTNGDIRVSLPLPEPDPYEFPPDQHPTSEQKITIHYKVPIKNGKSTRVMDVIKIPKTTQTIQDRSAAGTPNSIDSLSSVDSDLFDPHLISKPEKSPHVNDVNVQEKPHGPSVLTAAAASTPSSSSTPKHATPRLPIQEQSELARIPETRDDSESSLSESNLYISDDSNLAINENRNLIAGKADSTTMELLSFSLGHSIQTKHVNAMRSVENMSAVLSTVADSSVQHNAGVCLPSSKYSKGVLPILAPPPPHDMSSIPSVVTATHVVANQRTTMNLPLVQTKQSANSESRNSPDSHQALLDAHQTLLDSRRTVNIESIQHAAVPAKNSAVEEPVVVTHTGNRQASVLPQEAQVHSDKPDSKSESETDSLPEWRTEAKPTAVSESRAGSESDSVGEKNHHSGRDRTKKHKERSDKKSHRKHHRHSQGSSSLRGSKEERHAGEEASTSSLSRSPPSDRIISESESRTETIENNSEPPQSSKDLQPSGSKEAPQQQMPASPSHFNSCAREYYIVTPPPSSSADETSSEIKTLLIRRNPNMMVQQAKSKESPTSASTSAQSVSSTSASSPIEPVKSIDKVDSKPSTSSAVVTANESRTVPSSSVESISNRRSPVPEVGNRRSSVTREAERRKSPARGSPDITSSVISGTNQASPEKNYITLLNPPKTIEQSAFEDQKPKVTRSLRSNCNLNATMTANSNNNGNESKAEMTVMTRSRRAAESSNGNGNNNLPEQSIEAHLRKRKMARIKEQQQQQQQQQQEEMYHPMPTPLPPQDKVNTMEMFINIRNEVSQRQKTLIAAVQPKIPSGFHEYRIFRKNYLLESSPETKVKVAIPQMTPPPELPNPLLVEFQKHEQMRYNLRMRHYIEREKLRLSAEQDIMRVHGKAARAYANQRIPFSACVVFRDQEIYNMPDPLPPDDGKNIRTRFNGRHLCSLLQDVDIKYGRIKEELLQRHQHESSSLYAMQRLEWELKRQELKMWDLKCPPIISMDHVPMVLVNRDFDLLPPA